MEVALTLHRWAQSHEVKRNNLKPDKCWSLIMHKASTCKKQLQVNFDVLQKYNE